MQASFDNPEAQVHIAGMGRLLPRQFYVRDTKTVARQLLGQILCRQVRAGAPVQRSRIVETEAYTGIEDAASHTFGGRRTNRNRSMYLSGGHAYVYLIYGMYDCLNVVTRTSDHPEAVLIRAVEPLPTSPDLKGPRAKLPTNGPGKLCRHYQITRAQDGASLWKKTDGLWLEAGPSVPANRIVATTRVGVAYAGQAAAWPLRFYERDNFFISKK